MYGAMVVGVLLALIPVALVVLLALALVGVASRGK
jgi:hypothetical protein